MELNTTFNDKHYKSDSIQNGRIVKDFFNTLCQRIFDQSYLHWNKYREITGENYLPLLDRERNIYSTISAAINTITPIHLSEWPFNTSDFDIEKNRRVDFWCLHKANKNGKPINYFIEVKKGSYCLNKGTMEKFQKFVSDGIQELLDQTLSIKKLTPKWDGIDDVFLGLSIIHGYHEDGKDYYSDSNVIENIHNSIDKRHKSQLLTSTWHLPEDMDIQWDTDKCKFITIAGIVITKDKSK